MALLLAGCASACIQTASTTCEDGATICREGTVCAPFGPRTLCVSPEQLTACDGRAERDRCESPPSGRCYAIDDGLVCAAPGCGNGFVDFEESEQCDDFNTSSLDGCSADCLSNETCGNGIIDRRGQAAAGLDEECDDGGLLSGDGCSSSCTTEVGRWRSAPASAAGQTRFAPPGIAYDARRARIVSFGGTQFVMTGGDPYMADTLEWAGGWVQRDPRIAPTPRASSAVAYDSRAGLTILFGGRRESGYFADTWTWSGTTWTSVEAAGPSARAEAAMAYDPIEDRTILFGGVSDKSITDTWQLRDGAWTKLSDALGMDTFSATMTFDPVARAIVLVQDAMHYQLDGATWQPLGPVPADATSRRWLVFDTVAKQRLLIGAVAGELVPSLHTWAWESGAWTLLPRVAPPIALAYGVVADAVHGGVHITYEDGVDTWGPDGTLTTMPSVPDPPPNVFGQGAANDLGRSQVVLFGGNAGTRGTPALVATTHIYDGVIWRRPPPGPAPVARWKHAMAYDPVRQRVVLFGGEDAGAAVLGDTWEWDGEAWARVATIGPSPRSEAMMAFSAPLGQVVLFGGQGAATLDDTWGWDGTVWTRIDVSGPSPRAGAMLARDPRDGSLLLFGGGSPTEVPADGIEPTDETWRFTTSWTQLTPVNVPSARSRGSLVWLPTRQRLVLVGGEAIRSGMFVASVEDTWEWDGTRWRALVDLGRLQRWATAFASPDGHSIMTTTGENGPAGPAASLLALGWQAAAGEETCDGRVDVDGDGLVNCADLDCWWRCTPTCLPGEVGCASAPVCGDGTCSALETSLSCSTDCGAPPLACGDLVCDGSETCPSECP